MTAVNSVLPARQESAEARRQRRIEAFHPAYRRFVRDLSNCSAEMEDLAETFPALLFALSTGYGSAPKRDRSFDLICAGASLRYAADALGLPWWLRKLPPQAFTEPLPSFPGGDDYGLRIASLIPRVPEATAAWLKRVGHAQEGAGSDYALWLARQAELASWPEEMFDFMAAWAWYSQQPDLLGHRLLRRPWAAEMSFRRAREELGVWRQRLRLSEYLGTGIETPWLADGMVSGFNFVALRTIDDFINESVVLDNCLDQYADQLNSGQSAIFSIRKGERHVACVEIGLHGEEVTMPTIVQLRGARNRRAAPEVWQATFAWLGGQRLEPLSPQRHAPKPMQRVAARRLLWEPYLLYLDGIGRAQRFRRAVLERLNSRAARAPRRAMPQAGRPTRRPAVRQDGKEE
ncbi:MAG: PcfJ domain-containing protein [Hyphomicrobiaceae bacterium]